ncbi:OmpA family protein [Aestuariicella sp. G3-2]|uniref:OmpA family protein n=1 Tax=Pseudomaricurvus albidus TaxID=2842452 RepID=UPI001C0E2B05|nr:OmpA family protein [Aestuariicella albida]MBU3070275.1 OmpA family protein [Aestuariicella albida]
MIQTNKIKDVTALRSGGCAALNKWLMTLVLLCPAAQLMAQDEITEKSAPGGFNQWMMKPLSWSQDAYQSLTTPPATRANVYGDNAEHQQTNMNGASAWQLEDDGKTGDYLETQQVEAEIAKTVKLKDVVPAIHFASGDANIPDHYVGLIRETLKKVEGRSNVRLHFVGHTDNAQLSPELQKLYRDNIELSRERAGTVAEYFLKALSLPSESVSYEGLGESDPVASNSTAAGRAKNRRVNVEVWYDEISETQVEREVLVSEHMNRIKVCRVETVCKLRYKEGHDRRAKVKNLVAPLRYDANTTEVPVQFLKQIHEALNNLKTKQNVMVRFVGHTDNRPLAGRDASIYGNHLSLSHARARRVALAVQDTLNLSGVTIDSDGQGVGKPVASNDTEKGRMLNRRIEVEFWYDDPLQALPDEPQICPELSGAETVVKVYHPPSGDIAPVLFSGGQPQLPQGLGPRLQQLMAQISDKTNVRLRFTGYIANKRLDRRTAAIYGDDIGLSTARARRVMEMVSQQIGLLEEQAEFEGRGYVQVDDVVNAGFVESEQSRVKVEVIYDELAVLDDLDDMDITRINREVETENPYALNLMRITVDGKTLNDPGTSVADVQRCTDVALDQADIRFKHDNMDFKPRLNVTAWPRSVRYQDDYNTRAIDNRVYFQLYSNYPSRIDRAEVRVFEAGQSTRTEPLEIVPLNDDGRGEWLAEFENFQAPRRHLNYLVRVYDEQGRYDQTQPQSLWVVDKVDTDQLLTADKERELRTGYGESRLAEQHIPLSGGSIKVYGDSIPDGHSVWVAGRPVPLGTGNAFVAEELLPAGLHTVEVAVLDEQGNGELFQRDLQFKENDWFYVGIADFTLAMDKTDGPAAIVTQDDDHYDNGLSVDGRLAFYTNGKFGNDWELSASADTREGPVDELFSNFLDKTSEALFRRIDPDYYYPTFGDDSTVEEAAPTLGKFYVKLQNRDDYGLWGNFNVDYSDSSLARIDRTLYGVNGHVQSDDLTSYGDQRYMVDGFVADPGTVASRDELMGTDGSLYFLRHQDILQGSEQIWVEVRDSDSGMVLAAKRLVAGLDYDIDYIQGRVLLSEPLSSTYADEMLLGSDDGAGNRAYLVSRYEYTPGLNELDTLAAGGQAHYWMGDNVRVGMTAYNNQEDGVDSSVNGVDLTLRKSPATWVKLEVSQTKGEGVATLGSNDGGYTFNNASVDNPDASAGGFRIDSRLALEDVHSSLNGQLTAYMQSVEAGFSSPGQQTNRDTDQFGGTLIVPVTTQLNLRGKLDVKEQDQGLANSAAEVNADYGINDHWRFSGGLRYSERTDDSPAVAVTQEQGERVDSRLQADYNSLSDWSAYGYIQNTLTASETRQDNNRVGVGSHYRMSEALTLTNEVSTGDMGTLGSVGVEYLVSDRSSLYTSYVVENERSDNGLRARKGNLVSGFRTRYSDTTSIYLEERYSHGDVPTGLTHSTGVDLAPNDHWNFGLSLDISSLEDMQTAALTERTAFGFNVGYRFADTTIASALEYRTDDSENATTGLMSERKTWLTKNSLKVQLSENWRLVGKLNMSESQSSLGEFYDGSFTEAVLGYAFRPTDSGRLNALLKYTYFYNMPTTDQVTVANTAAEYLQKSHVISADMTYALTERWSLGGKYAFRRGELSLDREDPEFFSSDAYLYILRADWHLTRRWDLMLEGRMLALPDAEDQRSGLLLALYRQLGDNFKLGVGYNATDFTDDLTDLDYNSQGFFVNAIGKF